jgi:hypothetical protein
MFNPDKESRHAFGMRALGLPNTKHFHEITRIEDALARESSFTGSIMLTLIFASR